MVIISQEMFGFHIENVGCLPQWTVIITGESHERSHVTQDGN